MIPIDITISQIVLNDIHWVDGRLEHLIWWQSSWLVLMDGLISNLVCGFIRMGFTFTIGATSFLFIAHKIQSDFFSLGDLELGPVRQKRCNTETISWVCTFVCGYQIVFWKPQSLLPNEKSIFNSVIIGCPVWLWWHYWYVYILTYDNAFREF